MISKLTTEIWQKYENGKAHHNSTGMYAKTERCHRFYEGDQWHGIQSGGEELPVLNFIKPICTYKVATVSQNSTSIIFSGKNEDSAEFKALSRLASQCWEKSKMDCKKWELIKNACITGDHYAYCFDARQSGGIGAGKAPDIQVRLVNKTDVYFANEQNSDINAQEWIIIASRQSVDAIKKQARKNGIEKSEIELILPDDADETALGKAKEQEVKSGGKCTSLLYMRKTDSGLEFCRGTKYVIYQRLQTIKQLNIYPLCAMVWTPRLGSARGVGVVEGIIPNQIEVNRTMARRAVLVKRHGFANLVYDKDKIIDPQSLGKIGASVAVRNLAANPISSIVQYLSPAPMSGDAAALQNELISLTRELENASDAATGQVDPTKASGEAIKAARDQSAISLTEQTAKFRQFCEDMAAVWYKLWLAYSPNGIDIDNLHIPQSRLIEMQPDIRIDLSATDPYSRLARELALENALEKRHITFEEYVNALDDSAGVPKDKLLQILKSREQVEKEAIKNAVPSMRPGNANS